MEIGIVTGGGTGSELAAIFTAATNEIARERGIGVTIHQHPTKFHTYAQLKTIAPDLALKVTQREASELVNFYEELCRSGVRYVFRTALDAQTLYFARQQTQSVQVAHLRSQGLRLALVRDCAQGYYANNDLKISSKEIAFSGSFSRETIRKIISFARCTAESVFQGEFDTWVVYKHHLFSGMFDVWVQEICDDARIYQPNHATSLLISAIKSGSAPTNLLLIAGNEVGDIMHEFLLDYFGSRSRMESHSKTFFLQDSMRDFCELQTVHGSCDNLENMNTVNPLATMLCAADCLGTLLGDDGVLTRMSAAIELCKQRRVLTPDMSGDRSTTDVACHILDLYMQLGD